MDIEQGSVDAWPMDATVDAGKLKRPRAGWSGSSGRGGVSARGRVGGGTGEGQQLGGLGTDQRQSDVFGDTVH